MPHCRHHRLKQRSGPATAEPRHTRREMTETLQPDSSTGNASWVAALDVPQPAWDSAAVAGGHQTGCDLQKRSPPPACSPCEPGLSCALGDCGSSAAAWFRRCSVNMLAICRQELRAVGRASQRCQVALCVRVQAVNRLRHRHHGDSRRRKHVRPDDTVDSGERALASILGRRGASSLRMR